MTPNELAVGKQHIKRMEIAVHLAEPLTKRLEAPAPAVGGVLDRAQAVGRRKREIGWITIAQAHDALAMAD